MKEEKRQGLVSSHRVFGLDIHSASFTATALDGHTKQRVLNSGQIPMQGLERWVKKHGKPGDLYVVESGMNSFETVKRIKNVGGHAIVLESLRAGQIKKAYLKTDAVDSEKLAQVYLSGLAHEVWVPDEKTRSRREVLACYLKAVRDSTRNKNRISSWLVNHGITRKKGLALSKDSGLHWVLAQRQWTEKQKLIITSYFEQLHSAEENRRRFLQLMAKEVANDAQMLKLVRLFGICTVNAYAVSAIVGDISRFRSPKQLVAYIGLQPKVKQSGKSSRTTSTMSYGRTDLRTLLIQSAKTILRSAPADHPIGRWGRRKEYEKGNNVAAVAVARKLVVAIWYLMRGFYTNLEEVSKTIHGRIWKIGTQIGTQARRAMGYPTLRTFAEEKEKILLEST